MNRGQIRKTNVLWLVLSLSATLIPDVYPAICHIPQDNNRIDCHPDMNANQTECERRGCCWNDNLAETNPMVPMCYYPIKYSSYKVTKVERMIYGYRYSLEKTSSGWLPEEILSLHVELIYMSASTVRIRIIDQFHQRFEVPHVHDKPISPESVEKNLDIQVETEPFSLKVTHKVTGKVLFDSSIGPLLYSNQFIQLSTKLPSYFLYGLGEHRNPMRLTTSWQKLAFWTRDNAPEISKNLYGNNPFALFMDDDGYASGWFMMNANAMDTILQPAPALTFITTGGIIDLFVYGGTSAEDVIRQHWNIVGSPYFQPMWAMGFHLSRYGYLDINDLQNVMNRMKSTNFPYDTQWTDIDAMRNYLVFTYDTVKWGGLPELVKQLHDEDKHYTPINDPCIGSREPTGTYSALDTGLQQDIFIKHENGQNLIASVWPGECYMPDFTHPNALNWWTEEIRKFNASVPFDGLWIDMNEPASFVPGAVGGCPNNSLDIPWYVPSVVHNSLMSQTVCPSSNQYAGKHYNYHSLYGHIEAKVSMDALNILRPGVRHFILTRSHYAGTQRYAAHWSGDNFARWDDLYYTIPEIIVNNMFGLTFIGPDICGFNEDTTEELCTRWMQLGAFVPFMRNHNVRGAVAQDPAIWSSPARQVMKDALMLRYQLTPFWYSLYYQASKNMYTVIQPLFYLYPNNEVARYLDTEFMIGRSLLVAPVLTQGAKMLRVYLPNEEPVWYTFPDLQPITEHAINGYIDIPVSQETIGLYLKPGSIIPMMSVNENLNLIQNARNLNLSLLVTMPEQNSNAEAKFYWDNGLSLPDTDNTYIEMFLHDSTLFLSPAKADFANPIMLTQIKIAGIGSETVNSVLIDNIQRSFIQQGDLLIIENLHLNINTMHPINVHWIMNA